MNNKLKDKIRNRLRNNLLKRMICNIGKIVEDNDKIIIYVEQKKMERYKVGRPIYSLSLNGFYNILTENNNIINNFNLNKPIYYIFDSIIFNNAVEITSVCAHVIFDNCTFSKNVGIIYANEITFKNSTYIDDCPVYFNGNCFFTADNVEKITFINDNFHNDYRVSKYANPIFGMKTNANSIEIINSYIETNHSGTIDIKAKNIIMKKSLLKGSELYIDSQSIESFNSLIISENGLIIENANCNFEGEIESPITIYNGVDLAQKNSIINISQNKKILKEQRKKLVDALQKLNQSCQQLKEDEKDKIGDYYDKKLVKEIIKKDYYKS